MNYLEKELYASLKANDEIFNFLQDTTLDGLWYCDLENPENEWVSDKFWQTLGYDPEEMLHKSSSWQGIMDEEDLKSVQNNFHKHCDDPKLPLCQEVRYKHKNGSTIWIRYRGLIIRNKNGKPIRLLRVHSEITALKRATHEFRLVFETAPDVIVITDKQGIIQLANDQAEKTFGYGKEDLIGSKIEALIPNLYTDSDARHWENLLQVNKGQEKEWKSDFSAIKSDGSSFCIEANFSGLATEKEILVTIVIRDITERKKIEEQLRIKRDQFKNAFEFSAIGMALVSTTGQWLDTNRELTKMVGYTKEELLGMTFQDITHPDDLESDLQQMHQLLSDKIDSYQMEKRYFHKAGHVVWIRLSVSLVRNEMNEPVHFVSQIENITERKEVEQALRQTTDRLSLATLAAKVGIWEFDLENGSLAWDDTMFELYGRSKQSFSGIYDDWKKSLHPDDVKKTEREVMLAISGETQFNAEFRIIWPDGTTHYIRALGMVQTNESNEPAKLIGTNWDITDEKTAAENQTRNMNLLDSKNRELEQFAYVASHDLREPLLTSKNYAKVLLEDYGEKMNNEALHYVNSIIRASTRMEELISGLLDYSRLGSENKTPEPTDCQSLIEAICQDLENLIKKNNAKIALHDLPVIRAYPLELKLLFQNLIQNAIKFKKKEQSVEVHVSARTIESGHEFCIRDNGIGIDKKYQGKIFTIFRRLHKNKEYQGSGIGLAQVKKIVELHNGNIWIDSTPGVGSSFYFTILT